MLYPMRWKVTFTNTDFGFSVRTLTDENGTAWFVGKDVAENLGYVRTADAVRDHVDEDDKGVCVLPTPGGNQKTTTINESGVYSLIFSSKLPQAKEGNIKKCWNSFLGALFFDCRKFVTTEKICLIKAKYFSKIFDWHPQEREKFEAWPV